MRLAKAVFVVAGLLLLPSAGWAKTDTVKVQDFQFVPKVLAVNLGDTVVWKVIQECCLPHTSTRSYAPSWNSGPLALNATFSRVFTEPGSFDYACATHASLGMVGQITVLSTVPSTGWVGLALLLASLGAAAVWFLQRRRKLARAAGGQG